MSERNRKTDGELPEIIGYRTKQLAPLLSKWRQANPEVPWGRLLTKALRMELRKFAGKREQHLLAA